ncbi:MAG: UDP-3-O-[3-hydroxymyristoyl] N-acetylglucosamine deacetylase [Hyphomicrobiales bacterium]|nr:UDP-3-O-[3-hydroxymyristoyl] N-acetylglucosamine deacetylase [Hyphomicrobiales bacterium]
MHSRSATSRATSQRLTTLKRPATVAGTGVHGGRPATLTIHPATAGAGVTFARLDVAGAAIPARFDAVTRTDHSTVLGDPRRDGVATIEHVMAALHGLGVDDAHVEVHGPETPIGDGSSAPFVEAILDAGLVASDAPRRFIKVMRTVRHEDGAGFAEWSPAESGFHLDVSIDFAHPAIGRQRLALAVTPDSFARGLARARTFGFLKDLERLTAAGLALGASLDNCVALDGERVLNQGGLRFADEFVRHKALDALGDLALAGAPIVGRYRAHLPGHALNNRALRALMGAADAWRPVFARPLAAPAGEVVAAAALVAEGA